MKKQLWIPISLALFFITLLLAMAFTNLFQPVIIFIHNQQITALQAVACVVGAALGFYFVFRVLVMLGEYFLPKD